MKEFYPLIAGVLSLGILSFVVGYISEGRLPNAFYKAVRESRKEAFRAKFSNAYDVYGKPASKDLVSANRDEALNYIGKLEDRCLNLERKVKQLEGPDKKECL